MVNMGGLNPTPAFIVSLLPIPFLLYYNVIVMRLVWQVRMHARSKHLRYPAIYQQGRALGLLSACFALVPAVAEWRVFVLNPYWAVSYIIGGILGVWALIMVRKGLEQELRRIPAARSTGSKHKK